jgi:tetrapyrrole methylase family protein/MazG family protein
VGRHRPRITVVGLGPAGPAYLTAEAQALVGGATRTYLRTGRHPAVEALGEFVALDHLYEEADTFEEVYVAIVDELVRAATELAPEPIVYAVPGSPLVAERSVELLRRDARVDVVVIPGLSFLDLAWERLGIDPLDASVRLIDAEHFAARAGGDRGPFLVAQCWSQVLLSELKLAPLSDEDLAPTDVVLLHHLGLDDERVVRVSWWDLDRTVTPDHLTSLYIPELSVGHELGRAMDQLEDLVRTLRTRCPWDRVQTHGSLMPHLLEESYEVLDVLRQLDRTEPGAPAELAGHLQEELGDLLFQIVFHARLAEEAGQFGLADVARGVHDKLVGRHPHVFGDVDASTAAQVVANWEEIKKEEKGRASVTEGIPMDLPALLLSTKLQRKALSVGLPADGEGDAALDLRALIVALSQREAGGDKEADAAETEDLVGAALFAVAGLARRLGVDPETALRTRALAFRDAVVECEGEAPVVPVPDERAH